MGRRGKIPAGNDKRVHDYGAGFEFDGEQVEKPLTIPFWKPEIGSKRTFELNGFEDKESKEFEGNTFRVYTGTDLKTGEQFSFVPGGLFDHIVKENNIVNGDRIGVEFAGQIILGNNQRANQWKIYKLKKPAKVEG